MSQTSSDFVVKVSTRGVEEARRALANLESATSGVAGSQAKEFAASAQQLDKLTSSIEKMSNRLERSAKVSHRLYKIQRDALSRNSPLSSSQGASSDSLLPMPPSSGSPGNRSGAPKSAPPTPATPSTSLLRSLGVGALQGALPGQLGFVQRGPGAIAQILGMSLGNSAAQFGKAAFSGPGGLTNAIGSVPLIGGALAAPLANYMQQADQVMSFQRQQVELAPLLGNRAFDEDLQPSGTSRNALMGPPLPRAGDEKTRRARNAAAIDALGRDSMQLLGRDAAGGQAFEASLVRSGAAISDLNNRSYVRAAMGAQTTYGVGADITGAFALGSRTGAFAGQKTADPTQMLLKAIGQSNQLGLSGTEQQEYLQQIAEGIRNIERTGIPFQMDTVRNLQSAFTGFAGMSSRAAGRFAMGAQQRATDFMENGPQSAFDLNVFRKLGFKGGLRSYYDTLEETGSNPQALAQGQVSELSKYARSPIRSKAVHDVRQMAQRLGILDPNFAQTFVDQMSDPNKATAAQEDLSDKIVKAQAMQTSPDAAGELSSAAQLAIPSSMRRQADMSNATLAAGSDSVNVMLNASEVANKLGNEIGNFGGLLNSVSNALHSVAMSVLGDDSSTPGPHVRPAH